MQTPGSCIAPKPCCYTTSQASTDARCSAGATQRARLPARTACVSKVHGRAPLRAMRRSALADRQQAASSARMCDLSSEGAQEHKA